MKRILVFLPNGYGGAERMSTWFASSLCQFGYEPVYVVLGKSDGLIREIVGPDHEVVLLRMNNIFEGALLKMVRVIRKYRPAVLFSSFHYLNARLILAAKLLGGIRVVIRSENGLNSVSTLTKILTRITYGSADAIIAQTDEMKTELCSRLKTAPEKVFVLNNPVQSGVIQSRLNGTVNPYPDDGTANFVTVCRISRQKALDVLLHAFAAVHRQNERTRLTIVGDFCIEKMLKEELYSIVESEHLEDCVQFTGYLPNPYPYIKHSDCFVLSSVYEGMPNVLIEAQYLGVPAVSTLSAQAVSKIIVEGKTGYIVPVGDTEALADAMSKALKMKDVPLCYSGATPEQFLELIKDNTGKA